SVAPYPKVKATNDGEFRPQAAIGIMGTPRTSEKNRISSSRTVGRAYMWTRLVRSTFTPVPGSAGACGFPGPPTLTLKTSVARTFRQPPGFDAPWLNVGVVTGVYRRETRALPPGRSASEGCPSM